MIVRAFLPEEKAYKMRRKNKRNNEYNLFTVFIKQINGVSVHEFGIFDTDLIEIFDR